MPLFKITCTTAFKSARFCGLPFSLLKLTRLIYYYFALHNDVPTKMAVPIFCSIAKFVLEVFVITELRHFGVDEINTAGSNTVKRSFVINI